MIKTGLIIILALLLLHFICGFICIFFYLDKPAGAYFDIGDLILMLIFGPLIIIVLGFLYLTNIIYKIFDKIKNKIYERKTKV